MRAVPSPTCSFTNVDTSATRGPRRRNAPCRWLRPSMTGHVLSFARDPAAPRSPAGEGIAMQWAAGILVGLVAAIHFYILVLEMFLWRTDRVRATFGTTEEFAEQT